MITSRSMGGGMVWVVVVDEFKLVREERLIDHAVKVGVR